MEKSQITSRTTSIICDKYFAEPNSGGTLKQILRRQLAANDSSGCTRGDLTESSFIENVFPFQQDSAERQGYRLSSGSFKE